MHLEATSNGRRRSEPPFLKTSYKSECQEKNLSRGLGADTFLSRHSAQLFERPYSIRECGLSPQPRDVPLPPVVPCRCRNDAIRFSELTSLTVIRLNRR